MNGLLPSLGGVALFLTAGLGLSALVPAVRGLPWPRRLAWSYLLGLAGLGGALYALSHVFNVPLRRPPILATAVALTLPGALTSLAAQVRRGIPSRRRVTQRPLGSLDRVEIAGAAFLTIICLGLFAEAMTDPVTGWDARMTWTAQALWVQDEGTVDAQVLQRKNYYVSHPEYPLLLPVAQAAVQEVFAVPRDVHAFRALYAAAFAAFLLLIWDGASRWAGRLPALLAALAAAGVPALTFDEDSGAASGYSDLPLGCLYGAGLLLLLRSRRSLADACAAGLLLAGAVLTKNEGALLAIFVFAAAALPLPWRRNRRGHLLRTAVAGILLLAAFALLVSWRAEIPNREDEEYGILLATRDLWPEALIRAPFIVREILRETFRVDRWALFWIAAPVVVWVGRNGLVGRRKALASALAAGAAAPLLIAAGAYSIHPEPASLIAVTWSRFLIQGSLPLFLFLALALRELIGSPRV